MSSPLHIRLLGGLQIERDGEAVGGFLSVKVPALLAYLACVPRPHRRETLATLLWGEMPEADAKNNLRQALSNLRKRVGEHVHITRHEAAFNVGAPYTLDVAHFEQCVLASEDVEALQAAADLYRGAFLDGVLLRNAPAFEEWMLAQRARYRDLALHALHLLTEHYLQQRHYTRALTTANRLLALDNWREAAHRQLMRALASTGQHTAALAQYEICRHTLERELGVSPSAETRLLYERIRAVTARPRHNVPVPTSPFWGRQAELERIQAWVREPHSRLLTILGPGGVGKSRLALEAARVCRHDFLEGAWFVALDAVAEASGVAAAVAAAVGLAFAPGKQPTQQIVDSLRSREMLLVLDNVEHLLHDEITRSFVAELVTQAPGIKVLVTSRERLNLRAEAVLELAGLPFSPAADGGTVSETLSVAQTPAGCLFVTRACHIDPMFDPSTQAGALARLCQLVDGLPLALELAASWVHVLDVAAIADKIEANLDFLEADWPDMPARHRSLQALFRHSWKLLTPEEQRAFASLSAFRGGFTAEAALAVSGTPLAVLAGLVEKSLLRRSSNGRYDMHPLVLKFAADQLNVHPAWKAETRRRHTSYYVHLSRGLEPALFGSAVEEALRRALAELENLRLAWQTAVQTCNTSAINAMTDAFMQIFDLSGLYHDMQEMADQAVHALEKGINPHRQEDVLALGRAYSLSAAFSARLNRLDLAMLRAEAALHTLAPLGPHRAYAHSLLIAGAIAYMREELEEAVAYWHQSERVYREVAFTWGECAAQCNLAEAMLEQEKMSKARQYAQAAYTLAQHMENLELQATTLQVLAAIALHEQHFERAAMCAQQALQLHQHVGNKTLAANALAILARIASAQGKMRPALNFLHACVTTLRQIGHPTLSWRLVELGQAALSAGEQATAEAAWQEVIRADRSSFETPAVLRAHLLLAHLYQRQAKWRQAARLAFHVVSHPRANATLRAEAQACLQALPNSKSSCAAR